MKLLISILISSILPFAALASGDDLFFHSDSELRAGSVLRFAVKDWKELVQGKLNSNGRRTRLTMSMKGNFILEKAPGMSAAQIADFNGDYGDNYVWNDVMRGAKVLSIDNGVVRVRVPRDVHVYQSSTPGKPQDRADDSERQTAEKLREAEKKLPGPGKKSDEECTNCNTPVEGHSTLQSGPGGPPQKLLDNALAYMRKHPERVKRRDVVTIIDYTKPSNQKRLWIVKLPSGKWEKHYVAHGKGSGGLYATRFNGGGGSHTTETGFFTTDDHQCKMAGGITKSERGKPCMMLLNSKGRYFRDIMFHGRDYVSSDSGNGHTGRSWGCPAVAPNVLKTLIPATVGNSLVYAYGG